MTKTLIQSFSNTKDGTHKRERGSEQMRLPLVGGTTLDEIPLRQNCSITTETVCQSLWDSGRLSVDSLERFPSRESVQNSTEVGVGCRTYVETLSGPQFPWVDSTWV